jgi:hypothetical protein
MGSPKIPFISELEKKQHTKSWVQDHYHVRGQRWGGARKTLYLSLNKALWLWILFLNIEEKALIIL